MTRNYNYKDVDMLMASKTVAESFKMNISELSSVRTDWTEQYAAELITKIDNAIGSHLGIDAKKELRDASAVVASLQVPAKRDVSFFKTQIEDDFKKEPEKKDEILKNLGFTKYIKDVQKGNQEALIQLLSMFSTNMTDLLLQEITAKGMNPVLINNIKEYANNLIQANVAQESYKESTKEITQEIADTFNEIYDVIIGICKKASNYYKYEPLKKEQFTFSKIITNLGGAKKETAKTGSAE